MKRSDQWETVIAVGRHATIKGLSAFHTAALLDKLQRLASTLYRYYVWNCNEDTSAHTCKACGGTREGAHTYANCAGAKVYALESRAEAIGLELGLVVTTQSDPRGAPIKLWADKEDGRSLGVLVGGGR